MDVVHSVEVVDGQTVHRSAVPIPPEARYADPDQPEGARVAQPDGPPDKIDPVLREWLPTQAPDTVVELIIVFDEDVEIPEFPEPVGTEPRDSDRNQNLQREAQELVERLRQQRAERYQLLTTELSRIDPELVVRELFWLINGMVVWTRLRSVALLAEIAAVRSIEPRFSGEEPPQNEVVQGLAEINSDPYFQLKLPDTWMALLDTGIRHTHDVFTAPSHIGWRVDCSGGGASGVGPGFDPADHLNHGTSSAAILTANDRLGLAYRGVTEMIVDSVKVYDASSSPGRLDRLAAKRGFALAVVWLDKVIVAEVEAKAGYVSCVAQAADNAFATGAVVIAANGNHSPPAVVRCPGNAHRAIGVGAYNVQSKVLTNPQCQGPTGDDRIKPDVQGPTDTETAAAMDVATGVEGDQAKQVFGGTSGATPYVAGAAALLRSWLEQETGLIRPGLVYALLILFAGGKNTIDNFVGAGPLQLQLDGTTSVWETSVDHHVSIDVQIVVAAGMARLDAAIWWPEYNEHPTTGAIDPHNNIDLRLLDPAGTVRAESLLVGSVFERCTVEGGVTAGTWVVRITGADVQHGPQTVYCAAHIRA